ncbi:hypothetical protein EDC56_1600 [Sinobacterium caligoides]|uniref:Uncharacterized protein n=1 Tax=Sinobacterium caligoides TaxID=933926 RepID=A0A3N2DNB1_9GAMM|nr:hypothetical protein [Sinobacterium caligoides]ROS01172.1 hypothetical protein EDC56_1600 [Sinobacterium caligoides]
MNNNPLFMSTALSLPVFANEQLFLRKMQYFQRALLAGEELSRREHDDFWAGYDQLNDQQRAEVDHILAWAKQGLEFGERYHETLWQAALLNLDHNAKVDGKVEEISELTEELDRLVEGGDQLIEPSCREMYHYQAAIGKENVQRLLAAKDSSHMYTATGELIDLTKANIERMLAQLQQAYDQARRLLSPAWSV